MTTTGTILADLTMPGVGVLLLLCALCTVVGCVVYEVAVRRARADERRRLRADDCATGVHQLGIAYVGGFLVERCRHCAYLTELGPVWYGASNRKRRSTP